MKSRIAAFLFCIVFPAIVLTGPASASDLDVVVKISRIENTLNLLDDLSGAGTSRTKTPATAQIRAMLHGTDWIDPGRLIVIGLDLADDRYVSGLLIPHIHPNADFQAAFNARDKAGCYIISLPPGTSRVIPDSFEEALIRASSSKGKTAVMAQANVDRLLKKNKKQINTWLEKIENSEIRGTNNSKAPAPEDARAMISGMLDMASQLDTVSLGIDLTPAELAFVFSSRARPGSELAGLFTRTDMPARLSGFRPDFQINFRSGPHDMAGFMKIMSNTFGPFYQKIGIDFNETASLCKPFSGETAGGISCGKKGLDFEIISVLKNKEIADDFLENVYLPGIEKYSRNVAGMLEKQCGRKLDDVFLRTADSTVSGFRVVGVKSKIPVFPALTQPPGVQASDCPLMVYDTRMTTVNNLLLMASNDRRLKKMIDLARTFEETAPGSPLITLDMDLGAYFSALGEMMPDWNIPVPGGTKTFAGLGKIAFTVDLENGRINTVTSFRPDNIKTIIAGFKKAGASSPAGPGNRAPGRTTILKTGPDGKPGQLHSKTQYTEKDPAYWSEKGELAAAYGNDGAAVEFFRKAIRLDPKKSDYYFNLSVSYCEIGEYARALTSINKALAMDNKNGAYYYARGRILLLSAGSEKALDDFIQSARLDNKDARDYLKNVAHVQWE